MAITLNIQQVGAASVNVQHEQGRSVQIIRYGSGGDLSIRKYSTTDDVPTSGEPFAFFVEDDDGNGPAMGFWDGTNIQILISVTITDN